MTPMGTMRDGRDGRDVLVKKLCMKTLKVIGLMHALKAKLVPNRPDFWCVGQLDGYLGEV